MASQFVNGRRRLARGRRRDLVQAAEPEPRRVYDPERINRALALAIAEPENDEDPVP
jgi:hypothetical protein